MRSIRNVSKKEKRRVGSDSRGESLLLYKENLALDAEYEVGVKCYAYAG